jgi:hypothetical protein
MNTRFHDESILIHDIQKLLLSTKIDEKDFTIIPIPLHSNAFDTSIASLLNINCNYEFTIDFIDAVDYVSILNLCWVMFNYSKCDGKSREHRHIFVEISQLLEAFGNTHFNSTSSVTSMNCMELTVLTIWLETLTFLNENIFEKFDSKMWLDSLVQGLIQILNDKSNDSTSLVVAISALVFLIEHHKLKSSVLTETNSVQLLNLLLNKMVYPSTDSTLPIHNEFEASICRIGLYQMLKLNNFKISEVIRNEICSFITKWWERIIKNIIDPNDTSVTFPIKYVLSVFSIMFEMLPFVKEHVCNNFLLGTGLSLFQVLLFYFKSPDIRVSHIANSFLYQVLFELMRIDSLRLANINTELCNIEKVQREQMNLLNNTWQKLIASNFDGEQITNNNPLINIFQPIILSIQQNLSIISSLSKMESNKLLSNTSIIENSVENDEIIELKNRLFAMKTHVKMLEQENHTLSDEAKNLNKLNEIKIQVLLGENNDIRRKLSNAMDEICNIKIQYENATQKIITHEGLIKDAWDKNGILNELYNESQESLNLHKHQAEINKEKVIELETEILNLKLKVSELQEFEVMVKEMNNIKKELNNQICERLKSDQLNQFLQEKNLLYENRMIEQENMSKSLQLVVNNLTKELESEKRKLQFCEEDKENLKSNNIGLENRIQKQLELIQTINKLSVVNNVK